MKVYPEIFKSLNFLKNEIKVSTLESRNLCPFFYLPIEIAEIKKPREMLSVQNREIIIIIVIIVITMQLKYKYVMRSQYFAYAVHIEISYLLEKKLTLIRTTKY